MDIIEAARELGKAIQTDERYVKYQACREANNNDEALQKLIGEFNLIRMRVSEEINKEENKDEEKLKQLNADLRKVYSDIMVNETMIAYNNAKNDFDVIIRSMNTIIDKSIQGEDPATCDYQEGCTGDCSSCGGCH